MDTKELFIGRLLRIAPELKVIYNEHLVDNDILLPHVFMGDVTRFIVSAISKADGYPIVQRILNYFESELGSGVAVSVELIRASFVENLIGETITVTKLKPMMGPCLRREVDAICRDQI